MAGRARLPVESAASSLLSESDGEGAAEFRGGPEEPVQLRRLGWLPDASESAASKPPPSTTLTSPPQLRRLGPGGAQSVAEVAPGVVGEGLDGALGQEVLPGHLICGNRPRPHGNYNGAGSPHRLHWLLKFSRLYHFCS